MVNLDKSKIMLISIAWRTLGHLWTSHYLMIREIVMFRALGHYFGLHGGTQHAPPRCSYISCEQTWAASKIIEANLATSPTVWGYITVGSLKAFSFYCCCWSCYLYCCFCCCWWWWCWCWWRRLQRRGRAWWWWLWQWWWFASGSTSIKLLL